MEALKTQELRGLATHSAMKGLVCTVTASLLKNYLKSATQDGETGNESNDSLIGPVPYYMVPHSIHKNIELLQINTTPSS
jgi:hypothetical protein